MHTVTIKTMTIYIQSKEEVEDCEDAVNAF